MPWGKTRLLCSKNNKEARVAGEEKEGDVAKEAMGREQRDTEVSLEWIQEREEENSTQCIYTTLSRSLAMKKSEEWDKWSKKILPLFDFLGIGNNTILALREDSFLLWERMGYSDPVEVVSWGQCLSSKSSGTLEQRKYADPWTMKVSTAQVYFYADSLQQYIL